MRAAARVAHAAPWTSPTFSEAALGNGVFPTISAAAQAADALVLCQHPLVAAAGVLTATIRMMQQTRRRPAPRERHAEGVEGEVAREARAQRPGDSETRPAIEDDRQGTPSLAGRDVGLVRRRPLERPAKTLGAIGNGLRECVVTWNRHSA